MSIEREEEGKKGPCFLACKKAVKAVRLRRGRNLSKGWQYMRFDYLDRVRGPYLERGMQVLTKVQLTHV
jgi:hypothetical protein